MKKKKILTPEEQRKNFEAQFPKTIETFRDVGPYELNNLKSEEPSCFNEHVSIRKYKVTVDLIDEPIEVIHARLQKLWEESNNYHDHDPLVCMAKFYEYEFKGSRGDKRKT